MDSPRFCHTCPSCTFLGHHAKYDLYLCSHDDVPKFIARFDHDQADFEWSVAEATSDPLFGWAYERAKAMDLLFQEQTVTSGKIFDPEDL